MDRISKKYFRDHDAPFLARDLLGKVLVRDFGDGERIRSPITETEAYFGADDLANHASRGRTPRTEIMFSPGGKIYTYLIYGKYYLLNIVTGAEDHPQAVLIRGISICSGPGRIGKLLKLDRSFYGEDLENSKRIWIENGDKKGIVTTAPRVGIDYAGEFWKNKAWRFILEEEV